MTTAAGVRALPWEGVTGSEAETLDWGRRLASILEGGEMICLDGELGAGKTTFARGLAAGLRVGAGQVHSPSYSLVHLYRDEAGQPALYHVDLYRVDGLHDLDEIGLEDVLASGVPVAVEWAERLEGSRHTPAPEDLRVSLDVVGPDRRRLTVARVGGDG